MTDASASTAAKIIEALTALLGAEALLTDAEDRRFYAQDLMTAGQPPIAVVRPSSTGQIVALVTYARTEEIALFARGGGMSYSEAFQPTADHALIIDFSGLSAIREIAIEDGHVTVEAGCTWAALDAALAPHGVRARFWGPMSGGTATIGGSMSQGSVTFGTGKIGNSGNAVKSFELVTGMGEVLNTGSDGFANATAFNRHFGPDLTGVFCNDAGALGIKTAVTLELEPRPALVNGLSFAFDGFAAMTTWLRAVTMQRLASEVMAMDADVARQNAGPANLVADAKAMWRVGVAAGNPVAALGRMTRIALGGRRFLDRAKYTAHVVLEARDAKEMTSVMAAVRASATDGSEIVNTVPLMLRANPFPELPVTHPDGRRMLPVHGIFSWRGTGHFHERYLDWKAANAARMAKQGITVAEFFTCVAGIGLLYEPVFYWPDATDIYHERRTPVYLQGITNRYPANPDGRALVAAMVKELIALMRDCGSTHFQIGRLYPHDSVRHAAGLALLRAIKNGLDPDNIINPGALGR